VRERRAEVVVLELDPVEPGGVHHALPVQALALDEREQPVDVPVPHLALVVGRREQLARVLAHRLEHREARLARGRGADDQRRVEQLLEGARDVGVGHDGLERRERGPAAERAEGGEHGARLFVEELDAPVERRTERALPLRKVSRAARKQRQSLSEPVRRALRAKRSHASGGQLERERQSVERAADAGHGGRVRIRQLELGERRARPLRIEAHRAHPADRLCGLLARLRHGERRYGVHVLRGDPERRAARDENADVGRGRDERGDVRGGAEHLLEVVEHEQARLACDRGDHRLELAAAGRLGRPEGPRDRRQDQARLDDRREVDERRGAETLRGGDR
jgi:hypothetical protein